VAAATSRHHPDIMTTVDQRHRGRGCGCTAARPWLTVHFLTGHVAPLSMMQKMVSNALVLVCEQLLNEGA